MISKKIIITGGGTGGHVFPALAIAEELRRRGFQPIYVGSERGMEAKLAPQHHIPFVSIRSGAIKNKRVWTVANSLVRVVFSSIWAVFFLIKQRPCAVLGVGGYVSVPISVAAFCVRIPLYLQEQNVSVGIANRFLGQLASRVFLGFEDAKKYFPSHKTLTTGNPLRHEILSRRFSSIDTAKPHLLIMGGSQGSHAINSTIADLLDLFQKDFSHWTIVHQTGTKDLQKIRSHYARFPSLQVTVLPFIEDVAKAYEEATLVIARSGALTISELIHAKRPAILVPYPRRGQNDQTANAALLERSGTARVVLEHPDFSKHLWAALSATLQPETLLTMAGNYSKLHGSDALATIGDQIERDIQNV